MNCEIEPKRQDYAMHWGITSGALAIVGVLYAASVLNGVHTLRELDRANADLAEARHQVQQADLGAYLDREGLKACTTRSVAPMDVQTSVTYTPTCDLMPHLFHAQPGHVTADIGTCHIDFTSTCSRP